MRQSILIIGLVTERLQKKEHTFMAFIDMGKAYGTTNWNKMFEILIKTRAEIQRQNNYLQPLQRLSSFNQS